MTLRELKKVLPDEYGAWAMWLVPFLAGAKLAHQWNGKTVLWFFFLAVFYVLKNPFIEWILKNSVLFRPHPSKRERILISLAFPLVGVAGAVWFFSQTDLTSALIAAGIGIVLALFYLILDVQKQGRSLIGQWVGVVLLTFAAPLTAVALGGVFNGPALIVWTANILYFAHSIYTVRGWMNSRKRDTASKTTVRLFRPLFLYWGLTLLLAIAAVFLRWVPAVWFVLLLPTTIFIGLFTAGLYRRITIRQIGFLEVAHTLIFSALLILLIP
ncbi:hypothetical protein BMS3Abin05_00130 [bacterium BMS3Abin05]|nr:hypothetical protein BMS3Abin05_00130 [bacterium BMS3Abin05]